MRSAYHPDNNRAGVILNLLGALPLKLSFTLTLTLILGAVTGCHEKLEISVEERVEEASGDQGDRESELTLELISELKGYKGRETLWSDPLRFFKIQQEIKLHKIRANQRDVWAVQHVKVGRDSIASAHYSHYLSDHPIFIGLSPVKITYTQQKGRFTISLQYDLFISHSRGAFQSWKKTWPTEGKHDNLIAVTFIQLQRWLKDPELQKDPLVIDWYGYPIQAERDIVIPRHYTLTYIEGKEILIKSETHLRDADLSALVNFGVDKYVIQEVSSMPEKVSDVESKGHNRVLSTFTIEGTSRSTSWHTLTKEDCEESSACKYGRCSARDLGCVAASDLECRSSKACTDAGHCSAVNGECRATRDEDCKSSRDCSLWGKCSAVNGECRVTRDEDCKLSKYCTFWGKCSAVDGECKVVSDEDCKQNLHCKMLGHCSAVDGECKVVSDDDCKQHHFCEGIGHCSAVDGECKAVSDADCKQSEFCERFGSCSAVDGWCRATRDEDCKQSEFCEQFGRCSAVDGKCRAVSDADCESPCKRENKCFAVKGECVSADEKREGQAEPDEHALPSPPQPALPQSAPPQPTDTKSNTSTSTPGE